MVETRYYPAYLLNAQEYDDAEACLNARGIGEDDAQKFIALAKIHQSDIIVHADALEPDDFFLVIAEDGGKWRTWAARAASIRSTREKAAALMKEFDQDVEWRIFDLRQHSSLRVMN